jgi:hypothetical protein
VEPYTPEAGFRTYLKIAAVIVMEDMYAGFAGAQSLRPILR